MLNFIRYRLWAIVIKEVIQMKRDRATLSMIIAVPLLQLVLFGYAINSNPRHLPTAIIASDHSEFTRRFIQGLTNTDYFTIVNKQSSEKEAAKLLATNKVQFVLTIPPNFTRDLIRDNHPKLLLEADATDPSATGSAIAAVNYLTQTVFNSQLQGSLNYLQNTPSAFELQVHAKYNPDLITQYNIVPGLIGVVLTMTMAMITAIVITRERERGTMENLLATPVQPLEVMLGKVTPYIIVGYIQLILILILSNLLFAVPIIGSVLLLLICSLPFIVANLVMGLFFSTVAKNQLQAMQMSVFFFLPSILLSGFMFPFRGMPVWAQWFGELLPLTHFLRITRGIMLKGNGWLEIWPDVWPILVFLIVLILLGAKQYHRTLD